MKLGFLSTLEHDRRTLDDVYSSVVVNKRNIVHQGLKAVKVLLVQYAPIMFLIGYKVQATAFCLDNCREEESS